MNVSSGFISGGYRRKIRRKMIQLIVSDFDGTLAGTDLRLPEYARNFAGKLKDRGILFTVSTGRSFSFIEDYIDFLGIKAPVIVSNGAVIRRKDRCFVKKQFDPKIFSAVLEAGDRLDLAVSVTAEGLDYINKRNEWFSREENRTRKAYLLLSDSEGPGQVEKISIVDPSFSGKIDEIERMCSKIPGYTYVRYGNQGFDIISENVNKASAVKELAAVLEIEKDNILAVGDSENDVEMLSYAGIGAVVGNAVAAVRKYADYIAEKDLFDGVMEIIDHFC